MEYSRTQSRVANVTRAFEATQLTAVVIDCGISLEFLLQKPLRPLLTSHQSTPLHLILSRPRYRLLHPVAQSLGGIVPRSSLPAYRLYHRPVKIIGVEVLAEDTGGTFHFQRYP